MKRWIWIVLGALLLTALLAVGVVQMGIFAPALAADEASVTEAAAAAPDAVSLVDGRIVADARLVPVQAADLSAQTSGTVAEVLASEGETVSAGALLVRLQNADQQVAVAQAQAQMQAAQARLAEISAGARLEEIAASEAALAAAQARLERIVLGAMPGQIAQGEAAVSAANANLARLYEPADESALVAARADMLAAEASVTQAQRAYDQVKWRDDIGALPQSAALQQATIAYEAALARFNLLESGPSNALVAAAAAEVARQQASLDTINGTLPADMRAAEADVAAAQAQLDLLLAGARPEQIAIAEADVAAATAAMQQALVALGDTEVRAPFAGTVAGLNVATGEQVSPGATLMTLADLSAWQVETEDLTEIDVVSVAAGKPVVLTFDALPDLSLEGTVSYVRPRGADNRGDIVYTAVITPKQTDPRLLWNMTTVVTVD
ncbi:MAG: HlyD family secretion protein [Caldilineaceae bacterium]